MGSLVTVSQMMPSISQDGVGTQSASDWRDLYWWPYCKFIAESRGILKNGQHNFGDVIVVPFWLPEATGPVCTYMCYDCVASEPCSSSYQPVCLTCINAVSDADCQRRGYYLTCSMFEVGTVAKWVELAGDFPCSRCCYVNFWPCYKESSDLGECVKSRQDFRSVRNEPVYM